jgi:glycosyltransferase 2 family protein
VTQRDAIQISDQPEHRIRRPVDVLRCVMSAAWIGVLLVAAVAASATTTGAETDIVGASRRLPHSLIDVAPRLALSALLVLAAALGVSQLIRRQVRSLVEAVATGILTGIAAEVTNVVLRQHGARLYYAIIMARPGPSQITALDPYLAGLMAYTTIIGLAGRSAWRNWLTLAISVYAIVQLTTSHTTILAFVITLLAGRVIGLAVRYGAGSPTQRPSARDIAGALIASDLPVTSIRRVPDPRPGTAGSRRYAVDAGAGSQFDVVVFDRDQQAAGTFYRLYRYLRLQQGVSRTALLSLDRLIERRALLAYATEGAGVPTPRLRALVRAGPDAAVLAYEHCEGTTLAQRNPGCTDAELRRTWDAVIRLHAHHVAHRGLTADRIMFTNDGRVMLLDPGEGDVAATELQMRLDLAQLIAELALYVGPEKSAQVAVEKVGGSELVAVVPLLQPVALVRSTRHVLRRRRDILPAVRKALLKAVPGGEEVTPVQLERIRPRALVTLVASIAAVYLLAGELAQASLGKVLGSADWRWGFVALALSALTYGAAALALAGFVPERLDYFRTVLVQFASSFVTLVTPAAVGGAAMNVRYLQRKKIPASVAVASVGVNQVVAFVLHIVLLVVFGAITGAGTSSPIKPPTWAYFVVAGLVVLAGVVLAVPAGRRMVRARMLPTFGQVVPRLLEVAQQPRKLAEGLGGGLLLSGAYIACLSACCAAFGRSVPFARIGFVYLTGSTLGSIIPTPGGLGAVEAALTAGLTAAGVPGAVAVSAVLLFRLLTFWLPVPVGWVAMRYLERNNDL